LKIRLSSRRIEFGEAGRQGRDTRLCRLRLPPESCHYGTDTFTVAAAPWISCKLHTRIGSRRREAIASTDALAPLMVVMHGTR
jgi:hypothetical protein